MNTDEREEAATSAPEVMSVGPRPVPMRRLRLVLGGLILVGLLVTGGVLGWRAYRIRTDTVSLVELKTTYGAFLTPDGRNTVTVIQRPSGAGNEDPNTPVTKPASCAPLTAAAMQQQFPAEALDGVSTFQGGGFNYAVSLFSYRFADAKTATATFDGIADTADTCNHRQLRISQPLSADVAVSIVPSEVSNTDATLDLSLAGDGGRVVYEITLVRYKNVLSWQYSYRSGANAAVSDHNLIQGLSSRLITVDRVGG